MNIENLEVGKVYKNYKELCEVLGEKVKSGRSKQLQVSDWERYFDFERENFKYKINEIHDAIYLKRRRRGGGNNVLKTPLTITNPLLAEEWLIEDNEMDIPQTLTRRSTQEFWWKCKRCESKIYSSPLKRLNTTKGVTDNCITCPYCSMSKGAKRIYKFLRRYEINFKLEHMFDDLIGIGNKNLRFDFAIFNAADSLVSLIEFDGGYHDEELNPDIENYKTISTHDKLKDVYCKDNNLPLLRVHHTQIEDSFVHLVRHFQTIDITQDQKNKMCEDYDSLITYENERACLLLKLKQLDKQINNIK